MTKPKNDVTPEEIEELLSYDPETGILTWKVDRMVGMYRNVVGAKAGDEAGGVCKTHGYRFIKVNGRKYRSHRLAWLLHYGEWPEHQIDHINGDRADNRIENLRSVTNQQNGQAAHTPRKNVSSKYRGVYWYKSKRKWRAQIETDGKRKHIGYFDSELEAARAYDLAAINADYAFEATNESMYNL